MRTKYASQNTQKKVALLVIITIFGMAVLLGGCTGVLLGGLYYEYLLGVSLDSDILGRAMKVAFYAVVGLTVTVVGVLFHASGASEILSENSNV